MYLMTEKRIYTSYNCRTNYMYGSFCIFKFLYKFYINNMLIFVR